MNCDHLEPEWILRAREGDQEAREILLHHLTPDLDMLFAKWGAREDEAADLRQEYLISLLLEPAHFNITKFDPNRGAPGSTTKIFCKFVFFTARQFFWKRKGSKPGVQVPIEELKELAMPCPEDMNAETILGVIHRGLASGVDSGSLSHRHIDVFSLSVLVGLSYFEISAELKIKEGYVGKLLHETRGELRSYIAESVRVQ